MDLINRCYDSTKEYYGIKSGVVSGFVGPEALFDGFFKKRNTGCE